MTLPPGRARLATKPAPTGSPAFAITMGMVVVALLAANAGAVPATTIRSTLRRTKSAASSGRRSGFCSANRYSMVKFFPSIHPSLLSSCRNASTRTALPEAVLLSRKPDAEDFPCLLRVDGTSKAQRAWRKAVRTDDFFRSCLSRSELTLTLTLMSFNHFIRSRQHVRRNRQADLLGCFQIDDELELRRLLDGKIGGLGAFRILST